MPAEITKPRPALRIRDVMWQAALRPYKGRREAALRPLLEAADMDDVLSAEMPPDAAPPAGDAPVADHDAALRDAFLMAGENTFMAVLSGQMAPDEGARKLKELLMAHAKLCGGGMPAPAAGGGEEPAKPVKESRDNDDERERKAAQGGRMRMPVQAQESAEAAKDARIKALEARETCRALCEAADIVKPGKALLDAMAALPDEAGRRALLEEVKPRPQASRPQNRAPGGPGGDGSLPTSAAGLAEALTGRRVTLNGNGNGHGGAL
jgi:hypothetical protein